VWGYVETKGSEEKDEERRGEKRGEKIKRRGRARKQRVWA